MSLKQNLRMSFLPILSYSIEELGNIYTRLQNPTHDVLEQRFAALEGGAAALATSSGTSAAFFSIINMAQQGDNIVAARNLYGGTYTQFNDILPTFGINTKVCRRIAQESTRLGF